MPKKKTREEFIKEATEKHDGKYDYSKVNYVNSKTKVCIICPEHGEFEQPPKSHLKGCGCQKCSGNCVPTKEEFIKKAREAHGDKYDYSKVEYKNNHTKVCIICPEHGEFWQTPYVHKQGSGCSTCANEANGERCRSSKEEFIKNARKKHGDKYDYTKVSYVNSTINVCIICPKHGEFEQMPKIHLKGCGCPKCSSNYIPTKEEWIASSREVHGDKYDYSKVNYVGALTKVCIICPKHGEFWQKPSIHLSGCGCPKCGIEKVRESLSSSKEDFIKKACKAHGDKYDYSKVEYVNSTTKVCIKCPIHGQFEQTPHDHLRGHGCPKCNLSHLERDVMDYLDEHRITYDYQKRFDWLGRQSLDFYLPDYNVGIECQGRQHFFSVEWFGGEDSLIECQKRDRRKFKRCDKHGIKLLYYSNLGIEYPHTVFEDLNLLFEEIKKMQLLQ